MQSIRRNRRRLLAAGAALGGAALLPGCAGIAAPRPLDAARAPRPGDVWRYAYNSGWRNEPSRQFEVRCLEVGAGVRDRLTLVGDTVGDERTFVGNWELVLRPLGSGFALTELSPYLDAFGAASVGNASGVVMPAAQYGTAWSGTAKATATETLKTPAGSFDAVKVEMIGNRPYLRGQMDDAIDPVYMVVTAWYAPRARRVLRYSHQTFAQANNPIARDSYELIALTLK